MILLSGPVKISATIAACLGFAGLAAAPLAPAELWSDVLERYGVMALLAMWLVYQQIADKKNLVLRVTALESYIQDTLRSSLDASIKALTENSKTVAETTSALKSLTEVISFCPLRGKGPVEQKKE